MLEFNNIQKESEIGQDKLTESMQNKNNSSQIYKKKNKWILLIFKNSFIIFSLKYPNTIDMI